MGRMNRSFFIAVVGVLFCCLSLWNSVSAAAVNEDGGASRRARFPRFKLDNICDYSFVPEMVLGKGGHGKAELVHYKGQKAVLKTMFNHDWEDLIQADEKFSSEVKIHRQMSAHPNIVSLIGACPKMVPSGERLILVSYASGGTLDNYIQNHGGGSSIPMETKFKILLGLARALRFVEQKGYFHADAHIMNVLLENDATVKLVDFGLSVRRDETMPVYKDLQYYINWVLYPLSTVGLSEAEKLRSQKEKGGLVGPADPKWLTNLIRLTHDLEEKSTPEPMKHVVDYLNRVKRGRVQWRPRKGF